ncbi:MAG: hypothetical protein HZA31_01830 [Opitutae bacterium]|nr:hypothetical protein [Opitutae bacterium]
MRLFDAGERPMHTDEAVNGCLLGAMLEGETYRYDPQDRHGPVLYFASYPLVRAFGVTRLAELEPWLVRLVPAIFGTALLLALPLFAGTSPVGRGRRTPPPNTPAASDDAALPLFATALWLGFAAPFVYYGRYWIHETIFVLLTFLLIASVWRYLRSPHTGWAILAGVCAGLMPATKETVAITGLAGFAALVGTWWLARPTSAALPQRWPRDVLLALVLALFTAALLFSSFGRHPEGLIDAARAMLRFVGRARGEGHEKPWFTYLGWWLQPNLRSLPWFGWTLAPFAVVGAVAAWRQRRTAPMGIFWLLFTGAHLAIYSAIPYKTPWLALNFFAPCAVLGGIGFQAACAALPERGRRAITVGLLALVTLALARETQRLCFRFPAEPSNPLAYSPTVPDIEHLQARVEQFALTRPEGWQTVVQVVGDDYWPLPWYLRHFSSVGYWSTPPLELSAPVVISTPALAETVARRLGPGWSQQFFGLRPEVLVVVFLRQPPGTVP